MFLYNDEVTFSLPFCISGTRYQLHRDDLVSGAHPPSMLNLDVTSYPNNRILGIGFRTPLTWM
jgi:hypothetical protein